MENINLVETRYITELRANQETGIVSGTAIVFNQESNLLGGQFREIIRPSAATDEFLKTQDIVMKYNHNEDSILARYRKDGQRNSLAFNVDERGVHFQFKAKAKDGGLLESIASGDLNSCSFAFRVSPETNSESWEKRNDGTYLRTISKFDVVKDFSIVIDPAYENTSVSTRGLDELKNKEELQKIEDEKKKADELKKQEDQKKENEARLLEYYKKYEDKITALKK
jgi:HK97 family phage prohead protease